MNLRLLIPLSGGAVLLVIAALFWSGFFENPGREVSRAFPNYDQVDNFAEAFVTALETQDDDLILSLIVGYDDVAETLRTAALQDPDFLDRTDLTARQKLGVLALRDHYSAQNIARLSAEEIIQVHPDPNQTAFGLPPGTQILLHDVTAINDFAGTIALYFGPQFHEFPLIKDTSGWKVDMTSLFIPPTLTLIDVELMSRIAARGGHPTAWLSIYASLSGRSVDDGLLQLP